MIDLTPIDVRKKKGDFKRAVRGYDTDLVDDFLDLVAERLEELVKQNMALTDRLTRLEEQVGEYRQRDRALTEALVTAQEVREEVRRQAEKEAELKHREAEADAQSIRADALAAREREEEGLRRLRARRLQMIQSFRTFLERELAELDVTLDTLELEDGDAPKPSRSRAGAKAKAAPVIEAATEGSAAPAASKPAAPTAASENETPNGTEAESDGDTDWLSSILEDKK